MNFTGEELVRLIIYMLTNFQNNWERANECLFHLYASNYRVKLDREGRNDLIMDPDELSFINYSNSEGVYIRTPGYTILMSYEEANLILKNAI